MINRRNHASNIAKVLRRTVIFSLPLIAGILLLSIIPARAQEKEENLKYADLLYSQEEYPKAARQYRIFLEEHPNSPNVQSGWFRLGECYLQVGQIPDAQKTFEHIVKTYQRGAYVGSSAYRLAVLNFNAKNYEGAKGYFELASREMGSPEARHEASYYHARTLQLTGKFDEALALYDKVIRDNPDPKANPFHERSLLESARIQFDKGDKEKAMNHFKKLASTATTEKIRQEAIVRGGLIASEAGNIEESEELLNEALKFPNTSPWKSLAQVGSIFNAYTRQDYSRILAIYSSGALTTTVIEEYRPRMLLIVGHSFRIKKELDSAARLYSLVEARYPKTNEGLEAGYRRLQILYEQGNGSLPVAVNKYIAVVQRRNPEDPYIDMANLMKAEFHFNQAEKAVERKDANYSKRHYKEAAAAYALVREDKIKEKFHPIRLYKQGWAYLESDDLQSGIRTISRFIKKYPKSPLTPSALAKRGATYQSVEDFTFALNDYQEIIDKYPDASELELAMQQRALIHAHKRDLPKMIDAYERLLKRFPNTAGKAEGTYWIGVGHFDLEQYEKAIPYLENARRLDPNSYTNKASIRIILAYYQLEQIPQLTEAARIYIQSGRDQGVLNNAQKKDKPITIPKPVLEYLGRKLASQGKNFDAEFFLTHVSTPKEPKKTSATIWRTLADTRMKVEKYLEAIAAYDHFLVQTEEPAERGYAYLQRGKAQLALKKLAPALESANECLRIWRQGRYNAEARILKGDITAADGNLEDAAREYLVVSQIFDDPKITPMALTKAINVYISLGNQTEATRLKQQLRAKFPDYREGQ